MIASEDLSLVFLMETKLSKEEMTRKKYTLGFTEGLVVASNGSKGGSGLTVEEICNGRHSNFWPMAHRC